MTGMSFWSQLWLNLWKDTFYLLSVLLPTSAEGQGYEPSMSHPQLTFSHIVIALVKLVRFNTPWTASKVKDGQDRNLDGLIFLPLSVTFLVLKLGPLYWQYSNMKPGLNITICWTWPFWMLCSHKWSVPDMSYIAGLLGQYCKIVWKLFLLLVVKTDCNLNTHSDLWKKFNQVTKTVTDISTLIKVSHYFIHIRLLELVNLKL